MLVAQAIGRWGNWFNQELYGRPTDLPWGLEIDPALDDGVRSQFGADVLFHPTFLYEFLWNLAAFARPDLARPPLPARLRPGAALYVMVYTLGRGWIENLRIDTVQLDDVLGLRLNVWTSIVLFVLAAAYFLWSAAPAPGARGVGLRRGARRRRPGRRAEPSRRRSDRGVPRPETPLPGGFRR